MSSFINPFLSDYLPNLFWPAELATFGRQVQYLPQGDAGQAVAVTILWKEGASDEEVSPGRYSHIDLQNADLPVAPALGDIVQKDGKEYDVVRVNALAVGYSTIVLQEGGTL
ncbi:MAG TPA: hypothetical protein VE030_11240 [Burkholderiales bacterium]|nr:hypothetical protein [Burkholderiales bacterium]